MRILWGNKPYENTMQLYIISPNGEVKLCAGELRVYGIILGSTIIGVVRRRQ